MWRKKKKGLDVDLYEYVAAMIRAPPFFLYLIILFSIFIVFSLLSPLTFCLGGCPAVKAAWAPLEA